MGAYRSAVDRARTDPQGFWAKQAALLEWFKPFRSVLDLDPSGGANWFSDGELNACHEALDRHVSAGHGDRIALVFDSAMSGIVRRFTYREMQGRVAELAGSLRRFGVGRGDRVLIYMPMIPEAVMAMLACARLGAIHSVVFGGFGPRELALRIDHARPRVVIAASCGLEPGRIVPYKPFLDEAIERAAHRPETCIVLQRPQLIATLCPGRDQDWERVVPASEPAECVPVAGSHPLYILYTSGTTGIPKGVVRDTGGYLTALRYSMRAIYDVGEGDVFWAASDIGWVVGHSYIVYGPLAAGCTTVLYEGKPVGTPDAGAFWRVIESHRVKVLFTAPTAIRAVKRDDPDCRLLAGRDIGSLRAVFLAGERADSDTVQWVAQHLRRSVVDHWWQTETGWPIAANCLGLEELPVKPGSANLPVPGYDLQILDESGRELPRGRFGAITLRLPLPPGCLPTLWQDEAGFVKSYLSRYPGYYNTGDGGYLDADGYLYVMGRLDDVINVAGHRLSTGEIEEVLAAHPQIAECAVIPLPNALKGQVPVALVVVKTGMRADELQLERDLITRVRHEIGPVASLHRCLVVSRLPKTRSGKVLRATMRRIAAGEAYTVPATIEDPAALDDVAKVLRQAVSATSG